MRKVTPEHCAAATWELEGYVLDCMDISVYLSRNHDELEERIKEVFPQIHEDWVKFNVEKFGENRDNWYSKAGDRKWLRDSLTDYVHYELGEDEEQWNNSDSLYYQFFAECYNLCKRTQDGFWDTWDEYVISMPYLQEGYDRILAEKKQEIREERLGKFLD